MGGLEKYRVSSYISAAVLGKNVKFVKIKLLKNNHTPIFQCFYKSRSSKEIKEGKKLLEYLAHLRNRFRW